MEKTRTLTEEVLACSVCGHPVIIWIDPEDPPDHAIHTCCDLAFRERLAQDNIEAGEDGRLRKWKGEPCIVS